MSALIKEVLKWVVSRPVTIEYPKEETEVEPGFRGRHYADLSRCVGCSLCAIDCPARAIVMEKVPPEYEVPKKNPRRLYPVVNYFKCVFCYRCVAVCPVNAYVTTNEYRLATDSAVNSRQLSLNTVPKAGGGGSGR